MGIGVSLFLLAAGAVLALAVDAQVSGLDIQTVGVILMVVGGIGLLFSLLWVGSLRDRYRGDDVIVEERRHSTL